MIVPRSALSVSTRKVLEGDTDRRHANLITGWYKVLAGGRLSGCETLQRADACLWGILPGSARADQTPGDI
jgi:hypothetical protein